MNITISLTLAERKFLLFLSTRGGRVDMNKDNLTESDNNGLTNLEKKGAIIIVPSIGTGKNDYILTSIGTNLVDLIKASGE